MAQPSIVLNAGINTPGRLDVPLSYSIYPFQNKIFADAMGSGLSDFSGTDAATVIRQAAANLANRGGRIVLKTGTYTISTDQNMGGGNLVCIPLYSNTHLVGEGESTILKLDSKANFADILAGVIGNVNFANGAGPDTNIRVANLQIDGNKANRVVTPVNTNADTLVYFDGSSGFECKNILLDHIYAHDSNGNCLQYRYTGYSWIRDCLCENNGEIGIGTPSGVYFPNNVHDTVISNVIVKGGAWAGIKLNTCSNLSFIGCESVGGADNGMSLGAVTNMDLIACKFESNAVSGLTLAGTGITDLRIIGGSYSSNTNDGITIGNAPIRVIISGARIDSNTVQGIHVGNLTDGTITGNIIRNNNNGILLDDPAVADVIISGNRITAGAGYGVKFTAAPTGAVRAIGNDVTGNAASILPVSSVNIFLIENAGFNPQGWAASSPSVPVTGTDQQNTAGYAINVYLTGLGSGVTVVGITDPSGTLTSFTRTGEIGDVYRLEPGGKIRLTYTGSPTWKWYGL